MNTELAAFHRRATLVFLTVAAIIFLITFAFVLSKGDAAPLVEKVPCDFVVVSLSSDGLLLRPREATDGEPRQLFIYWGGRVIRRVDESGVCRS